MQKGVAIRRSAYDLAVRIDAQRVAARIAVLHPDTIDYALPPENSGVRLGAGKVSLADYLSRVVEGIGISGVTSQGAQVLHRSGWRPKEGVEGQVTGQVGLADHLTAVVQPAIHVW